MTPGRPAHVRNHLCNFGFSGFWWRGFVGGSNYCSMYGFDGGLADREAILAAFDEWEAADDKLAAMSLEALTHPELVALLDRRERGYRRQRSVDHVMIARLAAEASPVALGATSLAEVLRRRLRISRAEARRRIAEAADLGPRRAMTGEVLAPVLPVTAAGQARGEIGREQVGIIQRFFERLPGWVDPPTREQAEATLGRIAAGLGPEELRQAADRLLVLLHQDGEPPTDPERPGGATSPWASRAPTG